ncbi:glycoside hydrolase family 3 C-terminal domain-containing protein [Nonomuraea sp. NPDC050153]|uniref:glycoside hydrolase family 3 C-terminal domain-containing protein n=1 Tax=Nonomuraea sp. NPDC050153 TaxID=3364359 RepID=UPI0037BCAF4D
MTSEQLSLTEQASLTSGASPWTTTAVRDVVRTLHVSDGPHGLRHSKEEENIAFPDAVPATCYPPAVTMGSSWDPGLLHRIGAAVAREASALGVDVVLGPGLNIKRSPLCGRNFEYFSEDPHISGVMGAALVNGIQSLGIGACVKHFAVNNQETDRMRVSADVDERTLRELYLPAFEHIVREAKPYTLMSSYNRVNGVYASANPWLLTQVLREEWGFDGLVMSDWGAVVDRVASLAAGCDLQMPPSGTDHRIVAAVEEGRLDPEIVATTARRFLKLQERVDRAQRFEDWDEDAHHELAREAAGAGAVLLKNEDGLLPLDSTARLKVAVIGEFARTPRYQGHGSSRVNPTRLDNAWDALRAAAGPELELIFAPGFSLDSTADPALSEEAVARAAEADVVLLFLGLPDESETEGEDRTDILLPADQVELVSAVSAACSQVAVVLSNGATVSVSEWQGDVQAVLETWLGGQAGGAAVADVLFGAVNPAGKLTESIPLRLQDVPSYLYFPGQDGHTVHGEGRYVGYRHYDTLDAPVAYPFGHGLSYTTFAYSGLDVEQTGDNEWIVRATVTNTGTRAGAEVVQLYVAFDEARPTRPRHELRGFTKLALQPGESGPAEFRLTGRDLAWWSTRRGGWRIDSGAFTVEIGASSRDIRLSIELHTPGDGIIDELTTQSLFGEWLSHPVGGRLLRERVAAHPGTVQLDTIGPMAMKVAGQIPFDRFTGPMLGLDEEAIHALAAAARAEVGAAQPTPSSEEPPMTTTHPRHTFHPQLADRLRKFAEKPVDSLTARDFEPLAEPYGPREEWELAIDDREIPSPEAPIPVRVYRPASPTSSPRPCLVWLHGGAWVGGDLDMPEAHETARGVAGRADAVVVSVDYRLCGADVHFPAPHDDVVAAYRWVRANAADLGVDPARIAVGGASAGGNLAAGAALRLRDEGETPWQALLLYPLVHAPLPEPSDELAAALAELPAAFNLLTKHADQVFRAYLGDEPIETASPYAFPGLAKDLSGFPPTYVDNDEFDHLRSSGELFTEQLRAAGVDVEQALSAGVLHGHLNLVGLDTAHATLDRMAARLRKR